MNSFSNIKWKYKQYPNVLFNNNDEKSKDGHKE